MTGSAPRSTITLRALPGATISLPLVDPDISRMVRATAEAIAERTGVRLISLVSDDESVTAMLEGSQLVAVGFAAELRRVTDAWHERKFGMPLWGATT